MDILVNYYLEHKRIFLASEKPLTSLQQDMFKLAYNAHLEVDGLNPVKLATYPKALEAITTFISNMNVTKKMPFIADERFVRSLYTALEKKSFDNCTTLLEEYLAKLAISKDSNSIALAKRMIDSIETVEECPICMDGDANTFFQCGHRACASCCSKIGTCFICRSPVIQKFKSKATEHVTKSVKKNVKSRAPEKVIRMQLIESHKVDEYLDKRIMSLLAKSQAIDSQSQKELGMLLEHRGNAFERVRSANIISKEVLCFVAAKFLKLGLAKEKRDDQVFDWISSVVRLPNHLIRVLAVLNDKNPVPTEATLLKLSRPLKKWIVKTIDTMYDENSEFEMKRRRGYWLELFKRLHIKAAKWNGFKQAQKLAAKVRDAKYEFKSLSATIQSLYQENDEALYEVMKENPGLYFRWFRAMWLSGFDDVEQIAPILKKFHLNQLVELLCLLDRTSCSEVKDDKEEKVFRLSNGKLHWEQFDNLINLQAIASAKRVADMKAVLQAELYTRRIQNELWVDDTVDWNQFRLGKGRADKIPDYTKFGCTVGDTIKVNADDQIVFFVEWENPVMTYLDLTAAIYQGTNAEIVDYAHQEKLEVTHSGDIHLASVKGFRCCQHITFCPKNLIGKVEVILFCLLSWNNMKLDTFTIANFGFGVKRDKPGLGPGGCDVLAALQPTGDWKATIAVSFEPNDLAFTFMNVPLATRNGGTVNVISGSTKLALTCYQKFKKWNNTRSPPSFQSIIETVAPLFSIIKIIEKNAVQVFVRDENESTIQFRDRIVARKQSNLSDAKHDLKVIYFGGEIQVILPENVLVIGKHDPKLGGASWSNDPFAFLNKEC